MALEDDATVRSTSIRSRSVRQTDDDLTKGSASGLHGGGGEVTATGHKRQQQEGVSSPLDQNGQAASIAQFLETVEAQLVLIALVVCDISCAVLEMHLTDRLELQRLQELLLDATKGAKDPIIPVSSWTNVGAQIAMRVAASLAGFTLCCFIVEMLVLLVAFRRTFFSHMGYALDLVLLSVSIALELSSQSRVGRLLGALRIWRVARLVQTLLDRERSAHEATAKELEQEQLNSMQLTMETRAAEESLKLEYESRGSLEKVLQGYKDEVETLKEALNIAAQAVAQAEMANPSSSADALGLEDVSEQVQEASLHADYNDYYEYVGIGAISEGDESGYDYDSAFYSTRTDTYGEQAVVEHREEEEDTTIEELRVASDTREGSPADLPIPTRDDGSDFEDALESDDSLLLVDALNVHAVSGMRRQKQDAPRRKSQVFRSNELLRALESVEALATGVGESETAACNGSSNHLILEPTVVPLASPALRSDKDKATAPEANPTNDHGHSSLASVSDLKMIAIHTHRLLSKQKHLRNMLVLKTTQEEDESDLIHSEADAKAKASDLHSKAPSAGASTKDNANETTNVIGRYETPDIKWKAKIRGEIEKFMYPSLRLESLYAVDSPPTEPQRRSHVEKEVAIPSIASVEELMAVSTQVEWEKEKKYKNSRQSVPPNDHERVSEEDARRLRFDTKLEVAEGLLRMKDMASTVPINLPAATQSRKQDFPAPEDDEIVLERRRRAASLYHPNVVPSQLRIPRLPQTRKIIKEIQRHTTNQGQIKYYADKQNLFSKWKKLQVSQLHQQRMPNDTQPFTTLSPRSLFYSECDRQQILAEPIFSRIHDVKEESAAPEPLALAGPTSFTTLAATLVQAVHDNNTAHEDLVTMPNGRIVSKKHHLALHLQHFGLGDAKTQALSKSLVQFHSIHVLNLSGNRLTDASIIQLLQCLEEAAQSPRSARQVLIGKQTIALRAGSAGLRRKGNDLKMLNLSHNAIGRAGCAQIARFLGVSISLTHLDLSNALLDTGGEALAPLTTAIECHPSLQVVNLSHNKVGETGGLLIGDMITQPSCAITELDISWNQICRSGAIAIGMALRTNTALKSLKLAMNRYGDDGGEQLAAAMEVNTSLIELDLSRNAIGGRTAVAFGFYLRKNQSLKQLQLQDNALGATGAKALLHAVAFGSGCEIHLPAHGLEGSVGEKELIFDAMLPSLCSPFELDLKGSPYEFAVASELLDASLVRKRCLLTELSFQDTPRVSSSSGGSTKKKLPVPKKISLSVDYDAGTVVESASKRPWNLSAQGKLFATALFTPPPIPDPIETRLAEDACLALIRIIKRGLSSREVARLLDLALNDLYLETAQAEFFVAQLKGSLDPFEIVGRLWPCLLDGANAFAFLQTHLLASEQRRLVDVFGQYTIQFTTETTTGHWSLDLSDRRQRKIAVWFATINAFEAQQAALLHPKRTDCSQFGKGFYWRNAYFNRKQIHLNYEFFNHLPRSGVLEFDYVSTMRWEDRTPTPVELTDAALETLIKQVGAEVCSIYIPLHKRKDLKYQLLLLHIAMAGRFIGCRQAHHVLQHFPKNYDTCRFRVLLAVHKWLIDLEHLDELLERLVVTDRHRIYVTLGYLNVVSPLLVDMDYEVDFEREDEKLLLRALVDLSMTCPMDMIRIEAERSDVLVIYSMYQTNSVPATGKIFFRYVSHPIPSRLEWIKARQMLFRQFLCGDRLRVIVEAALTSGVVPSNLLPSGTGSSSAAMPPLKG